MNAAKAPGEPGFFPVSYTHLDVYKRQVKLTARALKTLTKNGAYATLKKAGVI